MLFVTNALSPAKVQRVSIVDDHERVMEVVVEDKQLSLAIGKKGQNVRLAAKLTGWRIDIKSEEEKRREVEPQFEGLEMGGESDETQPARATSAADADRTLAEAEGELATAQATTSAEQEAVRRATQRAGRWRPRKPRPTRLRHAAETRPTAPSRERTASDTQ